jgi:acyl-CoA hydrolase
MKKLIFLVIMPFLFMFTNITVGQDLLTRQIAFGAKGLDSLNGVASANTKYYYMNAAGTLAGGLVKSTVPITNYEIIGVSAYFNASAKTSLLIDTVHAWVEVSYDNVNWTKVTNGGMTTVATAFMTRNGFPKVLGVAVASGADSGTTYLIGDDLITTKNAAGGGLWWFNGLVAPYLRVACYNIDDPAGSAYPQIWVVLKKL